METNSHADTDQALPPEDAASNGSTDGADTPPSMEPPVTQQPAAQEEQVAAVEAIPEPVPELSTAQETPEVTETAGPPQGLNVTEESAAEQPAEVAAEESAAPQASDEPEESAPAGEGSGEAKLESDPLDTLAEQAQRARLSAPDEERAIALLKESLLEGRAGVTRAVAALPKLPWMIGVSAVSAVWKEMKTAFRTQLLSGLGKNETDSARRMRLSLARGLFKVDVPTSLKLAVAVAKEMRDKETGTLTPKNAQIFANVLIGRAKPWIAQIPLNELKPAEADLLVHCALVSAFSVPHAPVTQLGVIKWAAEAGRLTKLHDVATESTTRGLGRWSAKWQGALRKEVADLPEALVEALKAPAPQPGGEERSGQDRRQGAQPESRKTADQEESEEPAPDHPKSPEDASQEGKTGVDEEDEDDEDEDEDDEDEDEDEDEEDEDREDEEREDLQPRSQDGRGGGRDSGRPRPVYESKTIPRKPGQPQGREPQPQAAQQPQGRGQAQGRPAGGAFDLRDTLRQIESHVASLRSELVSTQNKLRQREQDTQKSKRPDRAAAPIIPGEPTPDELARLNQQLEARNAELQQRITELTQDSEDRAASMGRHGPEPVEQPDAQLRTLLSLKLQEDYEDFAALEKEKPDLVVQQHYRTVLRHVLDVLRQEGVEFHDRRGE